METPAPVSRSWYSMSDREQAVWAAAYATAPTSGSAVPHAERVVQSLAAHVWPENEAPEHRAARLFRGLTWDEFKPWYRVECQLRPPSQRTRPTEDQMRDAYTVYVQCGSDYY